MTVQEHRIYLDHNATAPVYPEVVDAVSTGLRELGNASSVHADGRSVRGTIEDARDSVGKLIGVPSSAITFSSGGTEANATVIRGLLGSGVVSNVYCSAVEHPSVLEHVNPQYHCPVNSDGQIDLNELEDVLKKQDAPFLFCIMLANNETGVIQPVSEVSALVHDQGGLVLCDSVQGPGKLSLETDSLGADFLTFSSHKIGGPQGVGCFTMNTDVALEPLLVGGGQEKKRRSGTENAPGIAGFGVAARITGERQHPEHVGQIRDQLEDALLEARPDAVVFGQGVPRISNTTNIAIPGVSSERQLIKLDLAGYSVSAGAACSSGKVSSSHVLLAMGVSEDMAKSSIRISIGADTAWSDLEKFVEIWATL